MVIQVVVDAISTDSSVIFRRDEERTVRVLQVDTAIQLLSMPSEQEASSASVGINGAQFGSVRSAVPE